MKKMSRMVKKASVLSLMAILLSVTAQGGGLYEDDFSDGTHDFRGDGTFTIVDDSAGLGSGNALRWSGGSYAKIGLQFTEISLVNVGDYISMAYDIRYETTGYGDYARLGFADDADNDSDLFATDYTGYTVRLNGTSTYSDRVYYYAANKLCEATGTTTNLSGSADWRDTDAHQLMMTVTRTTAGADVTIDWGGAKIFGKEYTGTSFAFDTIGLKHGSSGVPTLIDNVMITTNVPEPATLVLLALGGVLLRNKKKVC